MAPPSFSAHLSEGIRNEVGGMSIDSARFAALRSLKRDASLDLAERGKVLPAVVKLGGARVGMVRHVLRGFEGAAVLQEDGNASAPESVVAERLGQSRRFAALLDDTQHVAAGEGSTAHPVSFIQRRKQRRLRFVDLHRRQIRIEVLLRFMVQPDELFLAALFDHAQLGSLAFEPVVAPLEARHCADARKRVGHDRNDDAVAQSLYIHHYLDAPAVLLQIGRAHV